MTKFTKSYNGQEIAESHGRQWAEGTWQRKDEENIYISQFSHIFAKLLMHVQYKQFNGKINKV